MFRNSGIDVIILNYEYAFISIVHTERDRTIFISHDLIQ